MATTQQTETRFFCPGEKYSIDRAIHLARLAAGYAVCRVCVHRHETLGGPTPPVLQPVGVDAYGHATSRAVAEEREGPAGIAINELDVPQVRAFAEALGLAIRRALDDRAIPPRVALAGDGRWLTAEFVAAAALGLGRSGCRVVETGASTTGSLAYLIHSHGLDGGLLVGNVRGAPQTMSLKCWGPNGQCWSRGGQLDQVEQIAASRPARANRRSGGLERIDLRRAWSDELAPLFHGLRPLRFVLDSASLPLARQVDHLVAASACRIIPPRLLDRGISSAKGPASQKNSSASRLNSATNTSFRSRRVDRLRAQVWADRADFGLWVDGDGDTLDLVDEQGRQVSGERLMWALARPTIEPHRDRAIVIERDAPLASLALYAIRAQVCAAPSTREAMQTAMLSSQAVLGGGATGRVWQGGDFPRSDAAWTLGALLQLLSLTDQPLSEVLAAANA